MNRRLALPIGLSIAVVALFAAASFLLAPLRLLRRINHLHSPTTPRAR